MKDLRDLALFPARRADRRWRRGVSLAALAALTLAPAAAPMLASPAAAQTDGTTAATPSGRSTTRSTAHATHPSRSRTRTSRLTTPRAGAPSIPSEYGVHTLAQALAASYATDPQLLAERAKVRATDENVPQALAGWRPTVIASGSAGYTGGLLRENLGSLTGGFIKFPLGADAAAGTLTITQPLYTGGRTRASTDRAENQVMAERARLITQEQTSFTNVVNAYVGVIQAQQILQLDISNEQVLTKQLQATNDRFRVGEITRTDVAQAEAALAGATATRETAEGQLASSRATFQRAVGYLPPGDLVPPQPLTLPVRTEEQAVTLSASNNPQVVAALFDDASAKDAVEVAYSALMPTVNLQGQGQLSVNAGGQQIDQNIYSVTANLNVPLYQGGSEYSAVRQARQTQQQTRKLVDDARRAARQQAIQAWETLIAARATVDSTRSQITANRIALEGVEREAIVGSRTTLDVLNAQQALLQSEVTLVQNLASLVTASYQVAAAVGRLTARDLNLPVPLYDDTAYYNAVRDRWVGTGDYATDQPAR
ncbi:TolC family outer membrane protein [Acidisphaera rubrifaciens]|uniref:Secretion system type I outer membrane protein TolC n=1 Tax=Acidisphaera rubrifaciens HS-AP3 TaxID=1231350 RepID=A0A0D6PB29_9PROT|nr:TolC family outer membrane protein [Acidisphaera rubrifaciens]GAN78566.1 secretion system type I outer membrane protein TolC [Acidisphaera rubrifaciens HS-AP3]